MYRIYLSKPEVGDLEKEALARALQSGWIAPLGPELTRFEEEIAARSERKFALALSSGTAALHLALICLEIGPGDKVWCPTFTFCATANPIVYQGATPVFVDVDAKSWTLDCDLLAEELRQSNQKNQLPKALIAVDIYGQCADYERLENLCQRYGIALIADAAEALGALYQAKPAGSFGEVAIFSFNGNKIITSSGGGMLVTNSAPLATRARHLATQARDPAPHYQHSAIGYNYRLSNILAALGRAQLLRLEARIARKEQIFATYRQHLGSLDPVTFMPEADYGKSNHWLTCILLAEKDPHSPPDASALRTLLQQEGIESRPLWKPLHLQPIFKNARVLGGHLAESLFRTGLCLPSGPGLSNEEIGEISATIANFYT